MDGRDIPDEVNDAQVVRDIELTAALVVAASNLDRHLSLSEIDAILGVASAAGPDQAGVGASE